MKVKFVNSGIPCECSKCCFTFHSKECYSAECNQDERSDKKNGYFITVKPKPKRAGKYERLLKALLSNRWLYFCIVKDAMSTIKQSQKEELIAIKERMEKKGKK